LFFKKKKKFISFHHSLWAFSPVEFSLFRFSFLEKTQTFSGKTEDREKIKEAEMRGFNGESRAANNTLETINAAATAIASAENRVPQATVQVVINFVFNFHCFV
jgi:hypothetical protein